MINYYIFNDENCVISGETKSLTEVKKLVFKNLTDKVGNHAFIRDKEHVMLAGFDGKTGEIFFT
jgi:phosphotransferase system IIA component